MSGNVEHVKMFFMLVIFLCRDYRIANPRHMLSEQSHAEPLNLNNGSTRSPTCRAGESCDAATGGSPALFLFTIVKGEQFGMERLFLLYRILAQYPFIPATLEYFDIFESRAFELLRHTGASRLVGSGAV